MANVGKLVYKASGSDAGKLCFKSSGSDAGKLVYKVEKPPSPGPVTLIVTSSRSQVGPINSCGNTHEVTVSVSSYSGIGSVTLTIQPNTSSVNGTTRTGCAFPAENPPVSLAVVAIQPSTSAAFGTTKQIPNVAEGSFSISFTWNNGTLAGLNIR